MKKNVLSFLAVLLLALAPARATTVFLDDFQQLPSGATFMATNYVPATGVNAQFETNQDGTASADVVASNFLGSTRAFFELGSLPYSNQYHGEPTDGALTNQEMQLSFKLWIEQTKNPNHIGGVTINVMTTSIDSIDNGQTNLSKHPIIGLNDGGQVWVFTNEPSGSSISPVQIGSWSALAGTVMTNVLSINYPAGTFSFSINGVVLTNMPIPSFITNIYDQVRIDVFEGITGGQASQGNRFALDDVRLTVGSASANEDVKSYLVAAKGQLFMQTDASTVTASPTGFVYHADVEGITSNSVLSASNQVPGGAFVELSKDNPEDTSFSFSAAFTTKAELDTNFPSGTYTMTIDTANQGTLMPALALPADDYPVDAPQIVNFDAAQMVQPGADFLLQWSSFTGGTVNDLVSFEVRDDQGNEVQGSSGDLDGTATSALIPAGTLQTGTTYQASVFFAKLTTDTNSIPGATGLAGFFKQTTFSLVTVSTTNFVDLAVSKTDGPDPATIGASLTYTVAVQNVGSDIATGVTVTDVLPASVTFVSATPSQGTCTQILGVVTCDLGSITNGDGAGFEVVVTPTAFGSITNTASVTLNETDVNSANDTATAITTVAPNGNDLTASVSNSSITCTNTSKGTLCTVAGTVDLLNNLDSYFTGTLSVLTSCKGAGATSSCKLKGTLAVNSYSAPDDLGGAVAFYLSDDAILDAGDTVLSKKPIASSAIANAAAKGKALKVSGKVPKGVNVSGKFLIIQVDAIDPKTGTDAVTESDETNNTAAIGPLP